MSISLVVFAVAVLPTSSCTTVVRDYPDADADSKVDPYGSDTHGGSSNGDSSASGQTPDSNSALTGDAGVIDTSLPDAVTDASGTADGVGVIDTVVNDTGGQPVDAVKTDESVPSDADVSDPLDAAPPKDTAQGPCEELGGKFQTALQEAKVCTQTSDCHFEIAGDIEACACTVWVTASGLHAIETLQGAYAETCGPLTCPEAAECPDTSKPLCKNGVCVGTAQPQTDCTAIETAYKAEIGKAKACEDANECSVLVSNALGCGCDVFLSDAYDESTILALQTKYAAKCTPPTGCPACGEPVSGSCTNKKCITEVTPP